MPSLLPELKQSSTPCRLEEIAVSLADVILIIEKRCRRTTSEAGANSA